MPNPFARLSSALQPARSIVPMAAWQGGESTRLTASWWTPAASINGDLEMQLPTLRARSRWLVENNGYCAGFADSVEDGIIGPRGVQLRGQVRTRDGMFATSTNDAIEAGWADWGLPEHCDVARRLSWLDLQRLAARTVAVDGECFIRTWRGADNPHGFALQVIDTDLVDHTCRRAAAPGLNEIRMGIELDRFGGAVAYHVLTRHPSDGVARERLRIPAEDMLHLFIPLRAGQIRGVPWLAPVITDAQMLDGYEEAALVAMRLQASQMGILVPGDDAAPPPGKRDVLFQAAPGQFRMIPKGYTVHDWQPKSVAHDVQPFTTAILRCMARGARVSAMTLSGDLSEANYSSLRAGQAPERDAWRYLHQWIIPRLHRPTYRRWLPIALLAGQIAVDSRLASNYQAVAWKGRGWVSVDPYKDMQALQIAIGLGVNSRTKFLAEQGEDFEETIDELHDEQAYADLEGVSIAGPETLSAPVQDAPADTKTPKQTARATHRSVLRRVAAGVSG